MKMKNVSIFSLIFLLALSCTVKEKKQSLFDIANGKKNFLRISTIITAHEVRDYLSDEKGLDSAIQWCKNAGITRVFLECFRDGYTANKETLLNAKKKFEAAGIEASGGVTTTRLGKPSSAEAESIVSCYTDESTRKELQQKLELAASMFDTVMIDDFLFTDCTCKECIKAAGKMPMSDYRRALMTRVSRENMLDPAKAVNPNVKIIIKYPQWYDDFHLRGYDVASETRQFDIIWVGTETRDCDLSNYSRGWETPQYSAYFIMRWLGTIGGDKTGGGWFDALGTTPVTYIEQARQTVLADAKELMLFSFGGLHEATNDYGNRPGTGIADVEAFKKELPGLLELSALIKGKPIKGILAPKPANSDPYVQSVDAKKFYNYNGDAYIYNYIGMMGLPLVPSERIDASVSSAFFPVQVLQDPAFREKFSAMLSANKPVMITESLAKKLGKLPNAGNLIVLDFNGDPRNLLKYDRSRLDSIRNKMLAPLGVTFDAPALVGFYLFGDHLLAVENFNNNPVDVKIGMRFPGTVSLKLSLPIDSVSVYDARPDELDIKKLPSRTLSVFQY